MSILRLQLSYLKTPEVSQGDFNPSPAEVSLNKKAPSEEEALCFMRQVVLIT